MKVFKTIKNLLIINQKLEDRIFRLEEELSILNEIIKKSKGNKQL